MAEQPTGEMANTAAVAASLTDDLIVDILSRLPIKSLCRSKCVSPHWRDLISHPDHRRRLPQTLAGFFHSTPDNGREVWRFTDLFQARQPPLVCTPFSFMVGLEDFDIMDSCNGLVLCRIGKRLPEHVSRYVVCNPATKSWVAVPDSSNHSDEDETVHGLTPVIRLGFNPTVSRYFYVFVFVQKFAGLAGVDIYSSRIGAWSYKKSQWHKDTRIYDDSPSVFLHGFLHFSTLFEVVAVHVEGESWFTLPLPEDHPDDDEDFYTRDPDFIGQYHGHLCYINLCDNETIVSIWVIEIHQVIEWVLKRQVTIQQLKEKICPPEIGSCRFITIHPDCNWILYLSGLEDMLMAYDIELNEVHVIQNLETCSMLVPYVPLYAESLTDGH